MTGGPAGSGPSAPVGGRAAGALSGLPAGALRVLAYENAALRIELLGLDEAALRNQVARLRQLGLEVDAGSQAPRGGVAAFTVRAR